MSASWWVALTGLGGVGAVLRFRIDAGIGGRLKGDFPYGTLTINVLGSFALGVLTGAHVSGGALFALGTGLLGSFTTFSTWMFETERLVEDGETAVAGTNLILGLLLGLAAAAAGWGVGTLV